MCKSLAKILAGILVPSVLLLSGAAAAADIEKRTLRLSTAGNKGSPHVMGAEKFAALVSEQSGGKITVKIFPGGVLGPDIQNYSAMQGGTLDFNIGNASLLSGNVKEFAVLDFPYLFNTVEEADAVVDGPVGQKLFDKLPARGLVGLAYTELGFRHFNTRSKPIAKAEDIEGLKIRVIPTQIYVAFMNAAGANAVPMPYTETYTALETGAVDGMTNNLLNILDMKFYEQAKYLTLTNHMYNPQALTVSKKTWDKLSEDEKKILQAAATEASTYQRKVAREANAKALEQLKAEGMQVIEFPPEETAKLREKIKPVLDKFTQEIGPDLVAEIYAEVEKVRAKN
jgi:tripartite ATP-independent transporter DctP family solute receptor